MSDANRERDDRDGKDRKDGKDEKHGKEADPRSRCWLFLPGHVVHPIQWSLSLRAEADVETFITAVDEDGTIHFADGTKGWNHDPDKVRMVVERNHGQARIGAHQVLKMDSDNGEYCFYLGQEATPCRPAVEEPASAGDALGQLESQGGFMLSGDALLRMVEERRRSGG